MRHRAFLTVVLYLSWPISSQVLGANEPCLRDVPLAIPSQSQLGLVSHRLNFTTHLSGGVEGHLALVNQTGKEIIRVTLIVDYYDADEQNLFAIGYEGRVKGYIPIQSDRRFFSRVLWQETVHPDENALLVGVYLQSVRTPPHHGLVSALTITFADESSEGFLFSNSSFVARPLEAPDDISLRWDGAALMMPAFARIGLDARGNVRHLAFPPSSPIPPRVQNQLKQQLSRWRFVAATKAGISVDSQLNLAIRFREALQVPSVMCSLELSSEFPNEFVFLDLVLNGNQRWTPYYSGYVVSGVFVGAIVSP